jgi:hypothetical protein
MAEQKVEPDTFPENSNIIHKAALRMLNLCESMVNIPNGRTSMKTAFRKIEFRM